MSLVFYYIETVKHIGTASRYANDGYCHWPALVDKAWKSVNLSFV